MLNAEHLWDPAWQHTALSICAMGAGAILRLKAFDVVFHVLRPPFHCRPLFEIRACCGAEYF